MTKTFPPFSTVNILPLARVGGAGRNAAAHAFCALACEAPEARELRRAGRKVQEREKSGKKKATARVTICLLTASCAHILWFLSRVAAGDYSASDDLAPEESADNEFRSLELLLAL